MKAKEEKMPHPARSYKITSTGKLIDDALEAVETENPAKSTPRGFSSQTIRI